MNHASRCSFGSMLLSFAIVGGCGGGGGAAEAITLHYDFDDGAQGWTPVFADYPEGEEDFFELEAAIAPLPHPLPTDRSGFFLRGSNRSDDLWMSLTRRLTAADGIEPNTAYRVAFDLTFASDAASGCFGIGGAPGESVFMKVGASPSPAHAFEADGFLFFSLDKGDQASPGPESTSAGDVANGLECTEENLGAFARLERRATHRFDVTSTAEGELTVFVGTDSGFEGITALYFEAITLTLTAR